MHWLALYWSALRVSFQAKLAYRTDFAVGMLTSMLLQFAALSFLVVVFGNTPSLLGWRGVEVIYLFGMTAMCLGTSELLFNHIWMLPMYIVSGDLDRLLTYPVHSLPFFLLTRPELHSFGNLLTGMVLTAGALLRLDAPYWLWLLTPLWSLCGSVVYTSLLVIFGSLSFRFIGPFSHQLMIPHNLLQATRYPLSAYPRWLFFVLTLCLPVGVFHYLPASFVFGKSTLFGVLFAPPLAACLSAWCAQRVWSWGIRQYESTGS